MPTNVMPITQLVLDTRFDYATVLPHAEDLTAPCRVRIYRRGEEFVVIVSAEPKDEYSITNWAEQIAWAVYCDLGQPLAITFIEHYPKGRGWGSDEEWNVVTFQRDEASRFAEPDWRHMDKETVQRLVGQPLSARPARTAVLRYCPRCDQEHADPLGYHEGMHEAVLFGGDQAVEDRALLLAR